MPPLYRIRLAQPGFLHRSPRKETGCITPAGVSLWIFLLEALEVERIAAGDPLDAGGGRPCRLPCHPIGGLPRPGNARSVFERRLLWSASTGRRR